jgi:hypothetical protein
VESSRYFGENVEGLADGRDVILAAPSNPPCKCAFASGNSVTLVLTKTGDSACRGSVNLLGIEGA